MNHDRSERSVIGTTDAEPSVVRDELREAAIAEGLQMRRKRLRFLIEWHDNGRGLLAGSPEEEGTEQRRARDQLTDAARLLLDGPLSDILELRGERMTEVWYCPTMSEDWCRSFQHRGDLEHLKHGPALMITHLLVKQGEA